MNIPSVVGHHIHVATCWPKYGTIVTGTLNLSLTVTLHEVPADFTVAHLRVCYYSTCPSAWRRTTDLAIPLDANRNGSRTFSMPIDLSLSPAGSNEYRISYEIHYTLNGTAREQFQSTGWQLCNGSCTSPDRSIPWYEARGWYTDHEYANARLRSSTTCLVKGGSCQVEMQPGSGGDPTVEHWAVIDPNFHAGIAGTVLRHGSGEYHGSITIPTNLTSGTHKLALVSSDGNNAGVQLFAFNVP